MSYISTLHPSVVHSIFFSSVLYTCSSYPSFGCFDLMLLQTDLDIFSSNLSSRSLLIWLSSFVSSCVQLSSPSFFIHRFYPFPLLFRFQINLKIHPIFQLPCLFNFYSSYLFLHFRPIWVATFFLQPFYFTHFYQT